MAFFGRLPLIAWVGVALFLGGWALRSVPHSTVAVGEFVGGNIVALIPLVAMVAPALVAGLVLVGLVCLIAKQHAHAIEFGISAAVLAGAALFWHIPFVQTWAMSHLT